jgi:RimJ/RimL family protein N-acetyltransferase
MIGDLFHGKLVRLAADEPEQAGQAISRWGRDSEYWRLLDDSPPLLWSAKKIKAWFEEGGGPYAENGTGFFIHTLQEDRLIGFVGLWDIFWSHREAELGIAISDREFWGKGYGADALRLVLHYGFMEMNLSRITLGVFDYNARAIHSYEKAGFILEGRMRQAVYRDRERADIIYMGLLREEWLALNAGGLLV